MSCPNFTWQTTRFNWDEHVLGPIPRTCSHCGGINMDDAIVLIELHNWTIEFTTKRYKYYMNHDSYKGTPPVKLYVDHMSQSHIRKFNELIDKQLRR